MHILKVFSLFVAFMSAINGNAQPSNYEISVKLNNYKYDTVFLAYYMGGKTYVKDTGLVKNGTSVFKGNQKLEKGMYILVQQSTLLQVSFLVDDNTQRISFELDFDHPNKMVVKGSKASADLVAYLKFVSTKRPAFDSLSNLIKETGIGEERKKTIQKQIDNIDAAVKQYRKEYMLKNPTSLLSLLIKFNLPYEPPVFSGSDKEKEMQSYLWYKANWFNNASMGDPRMLRTENFLKKIDYYIDKLTVQDPDSIILSIDEVINRVKSAPESYKFLLIEMLNRYAKSNLVGMDAVYVHLALKYYETGKAPWTAKDQLAKIVDNAKRLEPILIGKKAPDLEVLTLDGEKTKLSDFSAEYTILFFWNTDCYNCSKSVSSLLEVEKQFRDKGVKIFSVCTDTANSVAKLSKEFVSKNKMTVFFNTMAPYYQSSFNSKYDIKTTPQLFILDKNKVIKSKKISADQVKQVLEYLLNKD
ncbi:MAG: redoxin domain-containing protein [Ferruginibacter sp.]